MAERRPKPLPTGRYWTDAQVAARLTMAMATFYEKRESLYAKGMPKPDPLIGKTDSEAIEVWCDSRSPILAKRASANQDYDESLARVTGN